MICGKLIATINAALRWEGNVFLNETQRMILESRREQMGLTQQELAVLAGISQAGYGKIANGENGVRDPTLRSILKVLGISKRTLNKGDKG